MKYCWTSQLLESSLHKKWSFPLRISSLLVQCFVWRRKENSSWYRIYLTNLIHINRELRKLINTKLEQVCEKWKIISVVAHFCIFFQKWFKHKPANSMQSQPSKDVVESTYSENFGKIPGKHHLRSLLLACNIARGEFF